MYNLIYQGRQITARRALRNFASEASRPIEEGKWYYLYLDWCRSLGFDWDQINDRLFKIVNLDPTHVYKLIALSDWFRNNIQFEKWA